MARAKKTLIDKNIENFIFNNFDKKDRRKDSSLHFEWFVNSMHIWYSSSQSYNSNPQIGKSITLGNSQGGDSFYISINDDRIYTLNDDIEEILSFLKNYGKTITFYFIQTKKTEHVDWSQFLNLIDVPLTIWKGQEFPKEQNKLRQIQEFIDIITDEDDTLLGKIEHKIAILFYTNKNNSDLEKLKSDWKILLSNKKNEFSEYFSEKM